MKKETDFKQDIANNKTTKPISQRNTDQANSQQNPEMKNSLTETLSDDKATDETARSKREGSNGKDIAEDHIQGKTDSKSSTNSQSSVSTGISQTENRPEHHEEKEGKSDVDNEQDSQVHTKESFPEEQYLKTSLGDDDFKEAAVIASATQYPKTYVSYWDCGGDEEYHATHHIHLSSDAVYILTFNMTHIISNDGRWIFKI